MSKKCIYNAAVKRAKELNRDLIDNHPIGVAVRYNYDLPSSERFRDAVGRLRPTMRELNDEFKAKNFGQIATLNTALSDGVGINITVLPAMELAYDFKDGKLTPKEFREEYEKEINKTPDNFLKNQERERPRGFYMGDRALEEQERRNDELNSIDIIPSDPETRPEVAELFESNPELANEVYSKLLANSGLSAENLLSLLLKDNLIEKQCS